MPTHGTLRRNNADVELNAQINISDLSGAGQLRFVPDAEWSGTDNFQWKGYDGKVYSDVATVTLTVNATNDRPNLDLNGGNPGTGFNTTFAAGGAAVRITGDGLDINDIDSETMQSLSLIHI